MNSRKDCIKSKKSFVMHLRWYLFVPRQSYSRLLLTILLPQNKAQCLTTSIFLSGGALTGPETARALIYVSCEAALKGSQSLSSSVLLDSLSGGASSSVSMEGRSAF